MTKEETLELALSGCGSCNHVSEKDIPNVGDFEEITDWYYNEGVYGPEHDCAIVGRLKDNRWVAIEEWEDTSGHGCRCDAQLTYHESREEALRLGISESVIKYFEENKNDPL